MIKILFNFFLFILILITGFTISIVLDVLYIGGRYDSKNTYSDRHNNTV